MSKGRFFQELAENVIFKDLCVGCAACSLICPFNGVLNYNEGNPTLVGECKGCGICLNICPRYETSLNKLEKFVFGRIKNSEEEFGIYKQICIVRSTDTKILKKCQDGGVVTALLASALSAGMIDGTIVSGVNSVNPWKPKPMIATNQRDIISNAGTRYSYSPGLLVLKEGVAKKLRRIAFVGTPCQIWALRNIQAIPIKKYANLITFSIGLFCSESFSYNGLMLEKIQKDLHIDLDEVVKINIKGGLLIYLKNGEVKKIPLKEVKQYSEHKCQYCEDFSAELADISAGGVGLDGWTMIIVRTDKGVEIFELALEKGMLDRRSVDDFASSLNLLIKLSRSKRNHAITSSYLRI